MVAQCPARILRIVNDSARIRRTLRAPARIPESLSGTVQYGLDEPVREILIFWPISGPRGGFQSIRLEISSSGINFSSNFKGKIAIFEISGKIIVPVYRKISG